jgi:chemotaxis protein MotA
MDTLSIAGVALALIAIVGGQALEGGHIASLLQATAFLIVIGGTAGAVMLQTRKASFMLGLRMGRWAFSPPACDYAGLVKRAVQWGTTARRGGILALEAQINGTRDLFEKRGLQMLVDGIDPEAIRDILEREIEAWEDSVKAGAKVWEAAGGYSPTIGILGAVMGLIHVMENLSDPSKLGGGIAVAFVATIYGVGAANLVFLPLANKLKTLIGREVKRREMVIEALQGVANGENPRIIEGRLAGFIVPGDG